MSAIRFLDTNILLYAYDVDAPVKREIALRYVENGWAHLGESVLSVQVLQEMHVNLARCGIPRQDIAQIVRDFMAWPVVDNSLEILNQAMEEQARWQLSLWDALILAAARAAGVSELITEDFNNGQNYGGIRAINPFL